MSFPAIIRDEMRLVQRPVPARLPGCVHADRIIELTRDAFLFTTPRGTRFHYQRGQGVAVEQAATGSDLETDLFYNGTVYGGVAWLNGLVPLHASSVVRSGRIIAFTGESGEGKSTLAAALARHGFGHRSDDVLLVEPTADSIRAWPDRDRIKLWDDAIDMVQARRQAEVEPGSGKFFAEIDQFGGQAATLWADGPLPLTDLIVLQTIAEGEPSLQPCTGSAKIPQLLKAMYRIEIPAHLNDGAGYTAALKRLGTGVRVWTLNRQRDRSMFDNDICRIARRLNTL